jgi:hypothetical protein
MRASHVPRVPPRPDLPQSLLGLQFRVLTKHNPIEKGLRMGARGRRHLREDSGPVALRRAARYVFGRASGSKQTTVDQKVASETMWECISALLTIVAAVFFGSACRDLYWASRSTHWPTTTGRLISPQVFEGFDNDGIPLFRRLKYHYSVDGVDYYGHSATFGPHYVAEFDEFSAGTSFTVYYCPRSPRLSVLQPGIRGGPCLGLD